jgi:methionine-rich copper-binding protein CopC
VNVNLVQLGSGRYLRLRSQGIAGVMALVAVVTAALPAFAHTSLVGSDPADGASLRSAPTAVTLTFDGPIQPDFAEVVVLDAAGMRYAQGEPQINDATVSQQLAPLSTGVFQVSYRVVAADGHPVTGTLSFSVDSVSASPQTPSEAATAMPPTTAVPSPTAVPGAPETASSEAGVSVPWALVSTGMVLLLALSTGLLALRLRSARQADNGGTHQPEREHLSEER